MNFHIFTCRSISNPSGWDASRSQGYPQGKIAGTHLYKWVVKGTVRVKCPSPKTQYNNPITIQSRTHLQLKMACTPVINVNQLQNAWKKLHSGWDVLRVHYRLAMRAKLNET